LSDAAHHSRDVLRNALAFHAK